MRPNPIHRLRQLFTLASILAIGTAGAGVAHAQQPSASPTPSGQRWCPEVPETPPPPRYELRPGNWAYAFKFCSSLSPSQFSSLRLYRDARQVCASDCERAIDLWGEAKNPPPPPKKIYQSTTKPQGPFQLPGGTTFYLVPAPSSSGTPTPEATPGAGQSSADPGGPFVGGYFAGIDLSATAGSPPDVAADVSPTQNVEFTNTDMFIWSKPALPISFQARLPKPLPR